MRTLALLLTCCFCIDFEEFYPSKQLFIYDPKWQSTKLYEKYLSRVDGGDDSVKADFETINRKWVKEVKSDFQRQKFVNYIVNVPKTFVITPNTISTVDDDDFCWIIFAYDSREWKYQRIIKSLLRATNEQFYERCGVARESGFTILAFFGDLFF